MQAFQKGKHGLDTQAKRSTTRKAQFWLHFTIEHMYWGTYGENDVKVIAVLTIFCSSRFWALYLTLLLIVNSDHALLEN